MPVYIPSGAIILNANQQFAVWAGDTVAANAKSLSVQLERQKSAHYPWGAAIQIEFGTDPSTFDVEIQGSETDTDASYVKLASITAVNASFVGRYDMLAFYPKFIRLFVKTLTSTRVVTAIITR
jgi:hypothetical protein